MRSPWLELQLERELHLTRRTEVPGREARALDLAESRRSGGQHRVAKVRMIEQIEQFGAELQVKALGDFGVLGHGEVGVNEIRPGERVSAQIAGMAGRPCCRRG